MKLHRLLSPGQLSGAGDLQSSANHNCVARNDLCLAVSTQMQGVTTHWQQTAPSGAEQQRGKCCFGQTAATALGSAWLAF